MKKYLYSLNIEKYQKKYMIIEILLDGLCLEIYIKINNNSYEINGYEDILKEIRKIS